VTLMRAALVCLIGFLFFSCIFVVLAKTKTTTKKPPRNSPKSDCAFQCPPGKKITFNPLHTPSSNGCGTNVIKIKTDIDFTPCCNIHDICYDTCDPKLTKSVCDNNFKDCMYTMCKELATDLKQKCTTHADIFSATTGILGCSSFTSSRQNACLCE